MAVAENKLDVVVLGAGLTGLSTALHLDANYLVVEKDERPGGLTKTEEIDGFMFDATGHWLHLRTEEVRALIYRLVPDGWLEITRDSRIFTHGRFVLYPFQVNLHGLPLPVLRECLQGAVQAAIDRASRRKRKRNPKSFEEFVRFHFGDGIARHFMLPYNQKLWGVSAAEVTAEWTQRFVPIPDIKQVIDGAIGYTDRGLGYNAHFLYPASGGIETLPRAMADAVGRDKILLGAPVTAISMQDRTVSAGGRVLAYEYLVSTLPLPVLVSLLEDTPATIRRAAARLRWSPLRYVNIALSVERPLHGAHWVYLPEPGLPFYRIGCASNAAPYLAPPGGSSLYVELANDRRVSERGVLEALGEFLKSIGSIRSERDILFAAFRQHPFGYVIYDRRCESNRLLILDFLEQNGIYSIGRYGGWQYNSMEDAILEGMNCARRIGGQS